MTPFVVNDGGREAAGYKGTTGDCVTRAVTIATQQDYQTVYDALSEGTRTQPLTRHSPRRKASARNGVSVKRTWFRRYMERIGGGWTPTMLIGSGGRVHLRADELPSGRLIVSVSKHYTTMIDGVIHDLYDPSRNGSRCVYGYWEAANE